MPLLCEGLTILDLSQGMAGGLTTMVLADAGAEVIKIEPPTGDWSRGHPAFIMWNRGKKSVVLDLKTITGQSTLKRLATSADVLMTSTQPGKATHLGAGYEELQAVNPALVYASITGFGPMTQYAHLKGYDGIVNAKTGRTGAFAKQISKDGPTYAALMCGTFGASMYALQGIMAALYVRERTGKGQMVETSLAQALFAYDWQWLAWQLNRRPNPPPSLLRGSPTPQYFVGRTEDGGWLQMANSMSHLMVNFMIAIGLGELYDQPRYQGLPNIPAGDDMEQLYRMIHARMQERTLDEWMTLFTAEYDIASEPFRHSQQTFDHPQIIHNGNWVEIEDPTVGRTKQLGPLVKCSKTPLIPKGGAPALGQHTTEVLSSLESRSRACPPKNGKIPQYPLEGVTVVEFATWFAAPFGSAILADMGARVVKIESLDGDPFRRFAANGTKPIQGKESLALDMKKEEGRKIAYALIKKADILMHNFRPGVPERLGIDYETVQRIHPNIVYLYAGSYGSTGPMAHRPAMHPIPGAICGGALYQAGIGMPPRPEIAMNYEDLRAASSSVFQANEGNPDSSSALGVAAAMLMGLYAREKHGVGQYMETTMIGTCCYANADDFIQYDGKAERTLPDPELNGLHATYRFYRAKEGWAFLACVTEQEWLKFCEAVERPDLSGDPRFTTKQTRMDNGEALASEIASIMLQRSASDWEWFLAEHSVACAEGRTGDYSQWANTDPALRDAGLWVTVEHPSLQEYDRFGPAVQLSSCSSRLGATSYVGEHTEKILSELGYTKEEAAELKNNNIATWTTRDMDPGD